METRQQSGEDQVVYSCSACGAMNRMLRARLGDDPVCGRCKEKVFPRRPVTVTDASWKKEVEDSRRSRCWSTSGRPGAGRAGRSRRCSRRWRASARAS